MAAYQYILVFVVILCIVVAVGVTKSNRPFFFKISILLIISVLVFFLGIVAQLMHIAMAAVLIIPVYLCIRGVK